MLDLLILFSIDFNLFFPKEYDNDKITLIVASIANLKNLKYHTSLKNTLVLSIICSKCVNEDEKILIEEESIKILKILGLSV